MLGILLPPPAAKQSLQTFMQVKRQEWIIWSDQRERILLHFQFVWKFSWNVVSFLSNRMVIMAWILDLAAFPATAVNMAQSPRIVMMKDSVTVYQEWLGRSVITVLMAFMHSRMVAVHVSSNLCSPQSLFHFEDFFQHSILCYASGKVSLRNIHKSLTMEWSPHTSAKQIFKKTFLESL